MLDLLLTDLNKYRRAREAVLWLKPKVKSESVIINMLTP